MLIKTLNTESFKDKEDVTFNDVRSSTDPVLTSDWQSVIVLLWSDYVQYIMYLCKAADPVIWRMRWSLLLLDRVNHLSSYRHVNEWIANVVNYDKIRILVSRLSWSRTILLLAKLCCWDLDGMAVYHDLVCIFLSIMYWTN